MSLFSGWTILDWIVLTIVLGSIVGSVFKGFAREVIALAAAVAGLLLASWFHSDVGRLFLPYVKTPDVASLLGFAILFAGMLLLGALVSLLVKWFLQAVSLQWFDRLLGATFGLVRGWVIASVVFLTLTTFPVGIESVTQAKLGPYLLLSARVLVVLTPPQLKSRFMDSYDKIQRLWSKVSDGQASLFDASRGA